MNKIIIVLLLSFSLNASAETTDSDQNEIIKLHVIQSEKIQAIMHKLSLSLYEEELSMEQINKLFDIASELFLAAEQLNQALPSIKLTVSEKSIFENIAKHLQIEANNLGFMAQNNDKEGMEITYKRLRETCIACHELFRF